MAEDSNQGCVHYSQCMVLHTSKLGVFSYLCFVLCVRWNHDSDVSKSSEKFVSICLYQEPCGILRADRQLRTSVSLENQDGYWIAYG